MSKLETIVGRILHVGQYTFDEHCHTYSTVEIETSSGRIDMAKVMAANELNRAIEPGREVAITVLRYGTGAKAKALILGVYDAGQKRTFVNEELFNLKPNATKQAVFHTVTSVLMLPVGFLLFVVPGLVLLWLIWKSWASIGQYPEPEEIRESVAALSAKSRALVAA